MHTGAPASRPTLDTCLLPPQLCGPVSKKLQRSGTFANDHFDSDGKFIFKHAKDPVTGKKVPKLIKVTHLCCYVYKARAAHIFERKGDSTRTHACTHCILRCRSPSRREIWRHVSPAGNDELARLTNSVRNPSGGATGEQGKKRLREIDRRIRFLLKRLELAEPVNPVPQTNREQVFFGATVTYCDNDDNECTVRIVGVDEARLEEGEVSWVSPIARALMQRWVGDVVQMNTPRGVVDIEVLEISYQDA